MTVKAPAKLNLGLAVLARRPDGYHALETVMQQVSLADTLCLAPRDGPGWRLRCSDRALDGEENLVWRAAALLEREAGPARRLPGVTITLYKNIPVAAGLAGGSSDAAAALRALNKYWDLKLGAAQLRDLGARLGADVPYCLHGGTVLATGRGETLQALPALPFFWVVLAVPPDLRLPTGEVYRALRPERFGRPSLQPLLDAVRERDGAAVREWIAGAETNALETAALALHPGLAALKEEFARTGLDPAMSGSGPSYFALTGCYGAARAAARSLQERGYRAYLCWTLPAPVNNGEG